MRESGMSTSKERMEEIVYAKTLLYLYPHLSKIAQAMEESMCVQARLSYRTSVGVEKLAERLLDEGEKITLLLRCERNIGLILEKFTQEELFVLECGFFRRKRYLQAHIGRVSIGSCRTFFRRQNRVTEKFLGELKMRKMDKPWFEKNFLSIDWVRNVYKKVMHGRIRANTSLIQRFILPHPQKLAQAYPSAHA